MSLLNFLLKVVPYYWQISTVKYLLKHKYFILADDMGLGKTGSAICCKVWTRKKMLVVCPAYLKDNWKDELDFFLPSKYKYKICKNKNDLEVTDEDIIVINYELIAHAEHLIEWSELIAVDEAQYLKSLTSGRTGHFHNFVFDHPPEYLMLMTGTPIKNTIEDYYSLIALCSYSLKKVNNGLNILDDYPTPVEYNEKFVRTRRVGRFDKVIGAKNLDILKTYTKDKFLRREKDDVLDLPLAQEKKILISYAKNKKLQEAYDSFNAGAAKDIESKAKSALLKAPFTIKYAQDLYREVESPIVIFTDHVESCKAIAEGLGVVAITGATPMKKRDELKKKFQNGEIQYLVATLGSMSTGHTLTAAHHMIFNDLSWIPTTNDQARDRIRRIGQEFTCIYHYIFGSVSDKHIATLIKIKLKVIKEMLC